MIRKTSTDDLHALCPDWIIILMVTALAAALRIITLDHLPPGLYHDEAFNSLDALKVIQGQHALFFEANNGREPLFIYLLSLSVRLWGRSPGAIRFVPAVVGTLTIPAIYLLGRELFDRHIALYASLIACSTVWMLNLSRVSFRAVTFVPLMVLALYFLVRGYREKRLAPMAISGLFWGSTLYTYLAARFTVVPLFFIILYLTLLNRSGDDRSRLWWKGWLVLGAVALLIASPLIAYWLTHWESTIGRAGQVSILNETINNGDPWGTLARHIWRTLRGFFFMGDFQPRHNVPLRAVFPWPIAIAFAAGIIVAFKRAKTDLACGLVILWTGLMLLPTILAEDALHLLRASGALPTLFFLPALGLDELRNWICREKRSIRVTRWTMLSLVLLLLICGADNVLAYQKHLDSPPAYFQFEGGATELATDINRFLETGWQGGGLAANETEPRVAQVCLSQRLWRDWPSVRFLCNESNLHIVEIDEQLPAPTRESVDGSMPVMRVLWPPEFRDSWIASLPRDQIVDIKPGAMEMGDQETEPRLLYLTMSTSPLSVPEGVIANFGDIRLSRYDIDQSADNPRQLSISLYWSIREKLDTDYTVFCHVFSEGQMIGQHDSQPATGYAPTSRWRPGDLICDTHVIQIDTDYDPNRTEIRVGMYQRETMKRLPLVNAEPASTNTAQDETYYTLSD